MDDNDCTYEARTSAFSDQAVVIRSERRRRWSDEAKLRIVQETLVAGAMAGFMPVELCMPGAPVPEERPPAPRTGLVEIMMPSSMRVTIAPEIERAALKKVLGVICELGR